MYEDDVAYICQTCGEAFAPFDADDWRVLRDLHKDEHGTEDRTRFEKTTVGRAF